MADSQDPDSVGFIQWRVSWYIAGESGSVFNFFNLFDEFLIWKSKAMAKDAIQNFELVMVALLFHLGSSVMKADVEFGSWVFIG